MAVAASTTLVCTYPAHRKITVDLNEAQGTAIVNFAAYGDALPAETLGPLAATFDSNGVIFDYKTGTRYDHYTINRITLDFTLAYSTGAPFDQAPQQNRFIMEYTCQVAKAQF